MANPYQLIQDTDVEDRLAGTYITAQVWNDVINKMRARFNTFCNYATVAWDPQTLNWLKVQATEPTEPECVIWIDTDDPGTTFDETSLRAALLTKVDEILPTVVGTQISAVVAEQIPATVAAQIAAIVAAQIGAKVSAEMVGDVVGALIEQAAHDEYDDHTPQLIVDYFNGHLAAEVTAQITAALPGEVALQIGDIVEEQLSNVVAQQLPAVLESQLEVLVTELLTEQGLLVKRSIVRFYTSGDLSPYYIPDAVSPAVPFPSALPTGVDAMVRFATSVSPSETLIYSEGEDPVCKLGFKYAVGYIGAHLSGHVTFDPNSHAGTCTLAIMKVNDTTTTMLAHVNKPMLASSELTLDVNIDTEVNIGDKFYMQVWQDTGYGLLILNGAGDTYFTATLI